MDGLNSNVITGKCVGCAAYKKELRGAWEKLAAVEEACKQRKFPIGSPPQVKWFVQDVLHIVEGD